MHSTESPHLVDTGVPPRTRLSGLWVAVALMYAYVDIVGFYKPGAVADILEGRVWELEITQGWALGALALVTVPILMVCLSLLLPVRAARILNIAVGALYIPVSVANVAGETWLFIFFGALVEVALLATIVWLAWSWPREADQAH